MPKKVLLCDFDGTIIHQDLEKTFLKYLLTQNEIKWKLLALSFITLPINLFRNYFHYPSIFKSWTFLLKEDITIYIDKFIIDCDSKITLRDDVLNLIKNIDVHERILLTGCYEDLVISFLKHRDLIEYFDLIIGTKVKKNYFIVERHPFGKLKKQFVNKNNYNIGVADSESDKHYLNICNEKYYV